MPGTKKQMQERRATLRPHPTRDQIVDVMRSYGKPISPMQISRITGETLGSMAYHMRTLVEAGVIVLADEGRARGAVEHFYALAPDEQEMHLTDRITGILSVCGALTVPDPDGGHPRPVNLDERAREDLIDLIDKLEPKVRTIASAATVRTAKA